jgi:serine/threonine protein kinase
MCPATRRSPGLRDVEASAPPESARSPRGSAGPHATTVASRYEVLDRLGVGGMAIVHRVHDRQTGRDLALKHPRWRGLAGWDPRFDPSVSLAREHRVLSRLDHPNIVRCHDLGIDESGEPFLLLELLDEPRTIVDYARSATPAQRVRALVEMFGALAYVHDRKLLHRDLKPCNVLVCRRPPSLDAQRSLSPRVCLIDFGLAAGPEDVTTPSAEGDEAPPSLVGSVLYLAPELVAGEPASPSSDMYAAGMIAAEVLTGEDPLRHTGPRTTLATLRDFSRDWLSSITGAARLDTRKVALLRRLLARDPRDRCSQAHEAASELEAMTRV